MENWLQNCSEFLLDHFFEIFTCIIIGMTVCFTWLGVQEINTSDKQGASSQPSYAQEIIKVGDVQWLCLTNDDKPVSCQLISPLTDDKLNNYQHIEVNG